MRQPRLTKLEEEVARIPAVMGVRVVGDDVPTEIHVVASPERAPKQIVRDVQSLCQASFGLSIDHRIVSIVQLDQEDKQAPAPQSMNGYRPVIERVVLASKGDSGWVKVALKWPDGALTEGAGVAPATRPGRARGAATALLKALEPILSRRAARVEIDHVAIQKLGDNDSVVIQATYYEHTANVHLVGSAIVDDDVATASVRALMHALNRKLT